ncbi:MAG: Cysteine--tRNA ligase [Calditrichaeota bacterium]|nr:Cysteine--tRNA ligase [Calditrichota bacterium]
MALQFYDTRLRRKIPFEPLAPGTVRMYNCGPTIYDLAHIGNFRAYIFADLLRRWLDVRGFDVTQVMNITDVDDKTIRRSRNEGVSLEDVTGRYGLAFFEDIDRLNIRRATHYPRATAHIDQMVELVQALLELGHAYRAEDGSIYFRVNSFPEYGSLSGKRLADLRQGERVSDDEYESKDDVRDFALWKAWSERDGDVFWETPLGKGRPGWHIECSAMSMDHLGREFDIHTGGVDNIFPHHENEIAQSVCGAGAGFARRWMHCEFLIVEGRKMSKSLGNFFTIRDLLDQGYRPREIRYVLAATQYRSRLNFTLDGLRAARSALQRLDEFRDDWKLYPDGDPTREEVEVVERAARGFDEAMDDDLNVSGALSHLFTLVRELNAMRAEGKATAGIVPRLEQVWTRWDEALGFVLPFEEESGDGLETGHIEALVEQRNEARARKDWNRADAIREQLAEEGIELKDGPEGTVWRRR